MRPPRGQVSRGMVAAAVARQAAAVVHARALAALARAALVDDDDGDAFGCVRLLLTELAAALHVEPGRQGQQGAGAGQGLPRTRRRREQRRAALVRLHTSSAAAGDGLDACSEPTMQEKDGSVDSNLGQAQELTTSERPAMGDAVIDAKDSAADLDAGVREAVSPGTADSAGTPLQSQQLLLQQQPEAGAEAPAPAAAEITPKAMTTNDEQPASAAPRVAAAAAMPHKRQAVAAGTAVGVAVGEGGKTPAVDEGTWTTVMSRRARRQERARLEGTACAAARKAAAARAAATRRTAAAVIEFYAFYGTGE